MADMGFLPDVRRILDQTTSRSQTLLFSATLDGDIAGLSKRYQRDPVLVEAGPKDESPVDVAHHFWRVAKADRTSQTAELVRSALVEASSSPGRDMALTAWSSSWAEADVAAVSHARRTLAEPADEGTRGLLEREGAGTRRYRCRGAGHPCRGCGSRRPLRRGGRPQGLSAPFRPHRTCGSSRGGGDAGFGRAGPGGPPDHPGPGYRRSDRVPERTIGPGAAPRSGSAARVDERQSWRRPSDVPWPGASEASMWGTSPGRPPPGTSRSCSRDTGGWNGRPSVATPKTGRSKGFGFVDIVERQSGTASALDGATLGGRVLRVRAAR
jgi:hypothetical protein